MRNLLLLFCLLMQHLVTSQGMINIAIVSDSKPDNSIEIQYEASLQDEISLLLQQRYATKINTYYVDQMDIAKSFTEAYKKNEIVITVGTNTSNYAASIKDYPKPTIASVILDAELLGLHKTLEGTSGINNFSYIESPFNIARDLNLLYSIYPFDHLEIITEKGTIGETPFVKQLFAQYLQGKDIEVDHVFYSDDIDSHFNDMTDKKVAVYALPYIGSDPDRLKNIFQIINDNKVPSIALFGEKYIEEGALAGYKTGENLRKIPRRIALMALKIIEGLPPSDLSVEMQSFGEDLIINMETARQIGIYPNFTTMGQATLANLDNINTDNKLTLHKAIYLALENSLAIKIEQADVDIADTEIGMAKSDLLPQLDVSSNLSVIDKTTTLSRQGAQGRANWLLAGNLSQVVFSEPLIANVAIQKMLKESEEQQLLQTQLDVVIDVTTAYMNILFAKSNLNIQQQNVERNKENFNISTAKEAIGYAGTTDINRWEAELANANIDLNSAFASLRQAKFQLNQLLNQPINGVIDISESTVEESMLIFSDSRMVHIEDYGALEKLSDFMVSYAQENLPELAQIDLGLKIQERMQLSRERAMYLPSIALSGSANRVLGRFYIPEGLPNADKSTSWDIGMGLSFPIFQGNSRKRSVEQSRLNVLQLRNTRKNTENQLEQLIRVNLENVGSSYPNMELAQTAADAARKNYEIVQDGYNTGQSNITTLIDAQNNSLTTELLATNAVYTFILDFLNLERSIGYFNFLGTEVEREAFFLKVQDHFNQN